MKYKLSPTMRNFYKFRIRELRKKGFTFRAVSKKLNIPLSTTFMLHSELESEINTS